MDVKFDDSFSAWMTRGIAMTLGVALLSLAGAAATWFFAVVILAG